MWWPKLNGKNYTNCTSFLVSLWETPLFNRFCFPLKIRLSCLRVEAFLEVRNIPSPYVVGVVEELRLNYSSIMTVRQTSPLSQHMGHTIREDSITPSQKESSSLMSILLEMFIHKKDGTNNDVDDADFKYHVSPIAVLKINCGNEMVPVPYIKTYRDMADVLLHDVITKFNRPQLTQQDRTTKYMGGIHNPIPLFITSYW